MEGIKSCKTIDLAKNQISGFLKMYQCLEQKVVLGGLSNSTLLNYGRCIAKISLHFQRPAIDLSKEEIDGYLQHLLTGSKPSKSYFKHTVYGLRFLFRSHGLNDRIIELPSIKGEQKLPVVLSHRECRLLFASGKILKHRVLLSLIYSGGLRLKEVRNLRQSDLDYDRMMIHIRQTKYNKDRYVPLSPLMLTGLRKYLAAYSPQAYLFNGKTHGSQLSATAVQWSMRMAVKRSGIDKQASIHTLRHSYATHLLESGMDIDTLSKLLGHANLHTTMVYLHVARLGGGNRYSPFDLLYTKK